MEWLKSNIGWIILVLILSLISSWFGWSYKSIKKENSDLHSQMSSMTADTHSVTILKPINVAGRPMTETVIVHDTHTQAVTNTVTQTITKTETVEKKSNAWLGLGVNVSNMRTTKLEIGYMLIGPVGVQVEPFIDLPTLAHPGCFLSILWKP